MTLAEAALDYAVHGWPVLPVKPKGKTPQSVHGVKDATTDEHAIQEWWTRWPDANIGIACGTPGPTVLDVDQPTLARPVLDRLEPLHAPTCATARGRHLYFRGESRGTVSFGYGELRGQGSYVIAPPSVHPSGKDYVWLEAPHGKLPRVPDILHGERAGSAGTGAFDPPAEPVKHGARHDFLKDIAVRTVRSGITDVPTIVLILMAAYEQHCIKRPKAKPTEFTALAEWAAGTDIADRERAVAEIEKNDKKKPKKATSADELDQPPRGDAPLAQHRAYLRIAGGWGHRIDIDQVRRHGGRLVDALEIVLSNGQTIAFDRQDQVTTRGHWGRTVIAATNGIANPPGQFKDHHLQNIYRSLCILADAPPEDREAEDLQDAVDDFLALAEPITDHDLTTSEGRYDATARCRARPGWDPRRADTEHRPVVLVDRAGRRYLRAGELRDYLSWRGLGISSSALTGRMNMVGARHLTINGREAANVEDKTRRTNRMRLYQLPDRKEES